MNSNHELRSKVVMASLAVFDFTLIQTRVIAAVVHRSYHQDLEDAEFPGGIVKYVYCCRAFYLRTAVRDLIRAMVLQERRPEELYRLLPDPRSWTIKRLYPIEAKGQPELWRPDNELADAQHTISAEGFAAGNPSEPTNESATMAALSADQSAPSSNFVAAAPAPSSNFVAAAPAPSSNFVAAAPGKTFAPDAEAGGAKVLRTPGETLNQTLARLKVEFPGADGGSTSKSFAGSSKIVAASAAKLLLPRAREDEDVDVPSVLKKDEDETYRPSTRTRATSKSFAEPGAKVLLATERFNDVYSRLEQACVVKGIEIGDHPADKKILEAVGRNPDLVERIMVQPRFSMAQNPLAYLNKALSNQLCESRARSQIR